MVRVLDNREVTGWKDGSRFSAQHSIVLAFKKAESLGFLSSYCFRNPNRPPLSARTGRPPVMPSKHGRPARPVIVKK